MKPEVQAGVLGENDLRVKVAELCGWKLLGSFVNCFKQDVPMWLLGDREDGRMAYGSRELPDYCNDLNEMHEAEKILAREMLGNTYMNILWKRGGDSFTLLHTSARQRAEAFVKVMEGKSVREGG